MRRGFLILLFAMVLAGGCNITTIGLNPVSCQGIWEQEYDYCGQEISIEGFNGSMTVDAWNEAKVKVTVHWSAKVDNYQFSPAVRLDEGQISLSSPRGYRDLGGTNYTISVPKGAAVVLINSNGRVNVTGEALARLNISSSNGSVMVDNAGTGLLTIRTSNALARVSKWKGAIDCATSNGSITAILDQIVDGSYSFVTSNGGISVSASPQSKFVLKAATSNGIIRNSLAGEWSAVPSGTSFSGQYNGGGAILTTRTSNGNVQLLPGE